MITKRQSIKRLIKKYQNSINVVWFFARSHKRVILLSFILFMLSGIFESNTLIFLSVGLSAIDGSGAGEIISSLGPFSTILNMLFESVDTEHFFILAVALAVLSEVVRNFISFLAHWWSGRLWADSEAGIKRQLFRQFLQMSYAEISRYKLGFLESHFKYADRTGIFLYYVLEFVGTFILSAYYIALLIWVSTDTSLLLLGFVFIVGLAIVRVIRYIRRSSRGVLAARVDLNEKIVEMLQGMYLLRAFNKDEQSTSQIDQIVAESQQYLIKTLMWNHLVSPIIQIFAIIVVGILLISSYTLNQGSNEDAFAQTITFVLILWRFAPKLSLLGQYSAKAMEEVPNIKFVYEMLRTDNKEYIQDGHLEFQGFQGGLELKDVTMQYDETSSPALHQLSFFIPKGQVTAIVGESGAGKSTLLDLLLRLYTPTGGDILVDGVSLNDFTLKSWRNRIGVVGQETFVFNWSVSDNIRFGKPEATFDEVQTAAKAADAHSFIMALENGYDTIIGDRGYRLSGGQRQRIAIARALIRDVEILILDEATSSLDSETERAIQETLKKVSRDVTIIIVAHRLSTVRHADQIIVLSEGRLQEFGTHDLLVHQKGSYARLWHLQST